MKYYCENCGAELIPRTLEKPDDKCSCCHENTKVEVDGDFETVAQWEARTGRKYPDSAPVYGIPRYENPRWALYEFKDFELADKAIVATEIGAPPENWRPE